MRGDVEVPGLDGGIEHVTPEVAVRSGVAFADGKTRLQGC